MDSTALTETNPQTRGFPGGSAGDTVSISGLGRAPGGGNGNPIQYSCLKNPWTVHGIEKSQIAERLSLSHYLTWNAFLLYYLSKSHLLLKVS